MDKARTSNILCPYCNQEMDKGTIEGNGRIIMFSKKEHFVFTTGEGEVMLSKAYGDNPRIPALRCKSCKIIIIDYSNLKTGQQSIQQIEIIGKTYKNDY